MCKTIHIKIVQYLFLAATVLLAGCAGISDPASGQDSGVPEAPVPSFAPENNTELSTGQNQSETEASRQEVPEADHNTSDNIITVYPTENIKYSDEVMPVQFMDDPSLMEDLKYTGSTYVYQDGKIYYRRYHEDSFEETALWGMYDYIPGTMKEMVCMDSDGTETELFTDEGYGDIFLVNDRFYMTDGNNTQLYSVDMTGNDRIDYGIGNILFIDRERNLFILQLQEQDDFCYYTLNYETGDKNLIPFPFDDYYIDIEGYQDGWLYYDKCKKDDTSVSGLCAASLEGEHREIITLTSDINQGSHSYEESILNLETDGDRIYFIFGGYDGSAYMFQGGTLISVKQDGTDYKAIKVREEDYYLCHENGKTLIYFVNPALPIADLYESPYALVWDVDADTCSLSEFPQNILYAYSSRIHGIRHYYPENKGTLCKVITYNDALIEETDIYAIPDDSGRIIRVAMDLGHYIESVEEHPEYRNLYYADEYLYFTAEYNVYDKDSSIGWRDGYRRLRTEVYRLKIGDTAAEMLYSY